MNTLQNYPPSQHRNSPQTTWRSLQLFLMYRLVLASSMGFAFTYRFRPSPIGSAFPSLFAITIVSYIGITLLSSLLPIWRNPTAERQVQIALCIDIIIITLLMHASGGVTSGLGLLIAISITIGSLLTGGNLALLFAALASLAVLGEQIYAESFSLFSSDISTYTQAGLLGITFFAVALLAYGLTRRLQETEQLAQQRGLDLANLAQVNEYIIQHMTTAVLVVDQDWTIRLLNDTARYLLGALNVKVGGNLKRHLPELTRQALLATRDPKGIPKTFHVQTGGRELRPQFILLGADQRAGMLIFLEDSARLLEQAQQMKLASLGRFTASIAHEVRNPLGAISHASELLAESPDLNQGDRRLITIIQNNSQRVNDVIEAILQLSRRSRAHPEYVKLQEWVVQFVEEFCCCHTLDTQCFVIDIKQPDIQIQADLKQLTQVMENICDNAVRYGRVADQPPRIYLSGGSFPDMPWPILEIRDDGPGIAPEHVRQIFEPFFTTTIKGTGLGLYIAKELCEINQIDLEYLIVPTLSVKIQPETLNIPTLGCFRLSFHNWLSE